MAVTTMRLVRQPVQVVKPLYSMQADCPDPSQTAVAGPTKIGFSCLVDDGTAPAEDLPMVEASPVTVRLNQPTISFHHQSTARVPTTELARELFQQSAPTETFPAPVARTGEWDAIELPMNRPSRSFRAAVLCTLCLLVGIGLGHVVREGKAYASVVSSGAVTASAPAPHSSTPREIRAASTLRASSEQAARSKDVAAVVAVAAAPAALTASRPAAKPARRVQARAQARAQAPAPSGPAAVDALFVDFEPSFRAAQ